MGVEGVVDTVRVLVLLPVSPVSLAQLEPPSVDICHCAVGVGVPVAAAVKVAVVPPMTVWLVGELVTFAGATIGTAASVFVGALQSTGSGPAGRESVRMFKLLLT